MIRLALLFIAAYLAFCFVATWQIVRSEETRA